MMWVVVALVEYRWLDAVDVADVGDVVDVSDVVGGRGRNGASGHDSARAFVGSSIGRNGERQRGIGEVIS